MGVIVDVQVLWKLVVASFAGGLGVALAFSLAVYGAVRFVDLRRDGHVVVAVGFALLAGLALAAVVAGVVYGTVILTHKG